MLNDIRSKSLIVNHGAADFRLSLVVSPCRPFLPSSASLGCSSSSDPGTKRSLGNREEIERVDNVLHDVL
ncbi:hypothetical protein QYF36_006566 [Acer negundo]|nr:hypothetical protein QYF36_006566 [Acer negundo]